MTKRSWLASVTPPHQVATSMACARDPQVQQTDAHRLSTLKGAGISSFWTEFGGANGVLMSYVAGQEGPFDDLPNKPPRNHADMHASQILGQNLFGVWAYCQSLHAAHALIQ